MQLTFRGCVYANPARTAEEAGPRDLTIDEIMNMRLEGLPVRVEHGSRASVGRVRASATDRDTGYTTVDLEFDDSVEGHVAAALVEKGSIRELSLCHDVYADNSKIPVEVSLVQEGARSNTVIFPEHISHDDAVKQYISRRVRASIRAYNSSLNMSTESAVIPTAVVPAPVVPAAVSTPVPVPAPVANSAGAPETDEPASKRQAVLPGDNIEKVARALSDADRAMYYGTLAAVLEQRNEANAREAASRAKAEAAERERNELAARYDATKTNTNSMARQLANVLDDLYRKFTPTETMKNEDEAKKITDGILDMAERHPQAYQHLAKLQVACSKWMEKENEMQRALSMKIAEDAEVTKAHAEKQRQRFMNMNAPDSTQPSAWMNTPLSAPVVTVAASAHGLQVAPAASAPVLQQNNGFQMPDFIRKECMGYGAGGAGFVRPDQVYVSTKRPQN